MDQSTGLESQIRVLKSYCEQNQLEHVEFFTDEGISGTKASRPSLDRLMVAVENDEISSVVVFHSFSQVCKKHNPDLSNALQIFKKERSSFRKPY